MTLESILNRDTYLVSIAYDDGTLIIGVAKKSKIEDLVKKHILKSATEQLMAHTGACCPVHAFEQVGVIRAREMFLKLHDDVTDRIQIELISNEGSLTK